MKNLITASLLSVLALAMPIAASAKTMKTAANIPGCVDVQSLAKWQGLINDNQMDAAIALATDARNCILLRKGQKVDIIWRRGKLAYVKAPWAPGHAKIPLYTRSDVLQ